MNIIPVSGPKLSSKNESQHFHAYLSQGAREGGLILTVAACLFLFMALFSHSAADPGWMSTGTNAVPVNYGGRAGAWSSDILLYFFGSVSYLFPVLIGYRACLIFRQRQQRIFHWPMFSIRIVGFVMTMAGATALMAIYSVAGLSHASGGISGIVLSKLMLANFNFLGSTLLLITMLLFGLTIFTGISWLGLMDRTGALTLKLWKTFARVSADNWFRFQDYRAMKKDLSAQQREAFVA